MQPNTLLSLLAQVLSQIPEYTDGKNLLKNKIIEDGLKCCQALIQALLSEPSLKKHFFVEGNVESQGGILVFDSLKFQQFVSAKQFLPDSYTAFSNKIGLTDTQGELLSTNKSVVLNFPYKDCILEGGQTKDDSRRKEIFWNQTLAPDEIDVLLNPKLITNYQKYQSKSKQDNGLQFETQTELTESIKGKYFNRNANGTITDNLIIKGNNLLALHSLKSEFRSKVKLIYIDPPYFFYDSKQGDSFSYNSSFKLSTWLVFMKNRLEIAKELLSDDGAIYVQISDDGVAELHLLLKDIFNKNGQNNFVNKITLKTKSPSGFASVNAGVFETAEYILCFAKNKKKWNYNPQFIETNFDTNYKWYVKNINENINKWEVVDLFDFVASKNGFGNKKEALKKISSSVLKGMVSDFALENSKSVFRYTEIGDDAGIEVVKLREKSKIEKQKIFEIKRETKYDVLMLNGREMAFYSKKIRLINGKDAPTMQISNIWTDIAYEGIATEGGVTLKGGKKPERLLQRIIEMSTNPTDIVLDYHLGSGTTAAVAQKMGRQYIGIEQMDYIEDISCERMRKVLDGEQGGISKSVNWQGGGEFIYLELKKYNQIFIESIQLAKTTKALLEIWRTMQTRGFISYQVDPKNFDSNISKFEKLSIENQKLFLLQVLDQNLLYINRSEINNGDYQVTEEEKEINTEFYNLK